MKAKGYGKVPELDMEQLDKIASIEDYFNDKEKELKLILIEDYIKRNKVTKTDESVDKEEYEEIPISIYELVGYKQVYQPAKFDKFIKKNFGKMNKYMKLVNPVYKIYGQNFFEVADQLEALRTVVGDYRKNLLKIKNTDISSPEKNEISEMHIKKMFSNVREYNKCVGRIIKDLPELTVKNGDYFKSTYGLEARIVNSKFEHLIESNNTISAQISSIWWIYDMLNSRIVPDVKKLSVRLNKNVTYPDIDLKGAEIIKYIREKYDKDKYNIKVDKKFFVLCKMDKYKSIIIRKKDKTKK